MQNTGAERPEPYFLFEHPSHILPLLVKYLPRDAVIVEAGSYDGKESCLLASLWPEGHVHAFEPVAQLFEKVQQRIAEIPNITAYPLALSDRSGLQKMYLSVEPECNFVSQSSSLYLPKDHLVYSETLFEGVETVQTTTLDEWAEERGIERVDLLWLDMQGHELPALKAGTKILATVSAIVIELEFVEAYEGQPLYKEVKEWLEQQGFSLIGGNFDFPKAKNIWFGDGAFVRKKKISKKGGCK